MIFFAKSQRISLSKKIKILIVIGIICVLACVVSLIVMSNASKAQAWSAYLFFLSILLIIISFSISNECEKKYHQMCEKIIKDAEILYANANGQVALNYPAALVDLIVYDGIKNCPQCHSALDINNNYGLYYANEKQKKVLEGVYITKSYGSDVKQAEVYQLESKPFLCIKKSCPKCEYALYRSMVKYYNEESYKIREDDGYGTYTGWVEKNYYVYAIYDGKLTEKSLTEVKKLLEKKGKIVSSSSFIKN